MKVIQAKNAARATLAAAALLTAAGPAQARSTPYVFTVIDTARHGVEVVNGDYDEAIARIRSHAGNQTNFSESTNLCIAYTKLGDADVAMVYCNRAVGIARETDGMRRTRGAYASFGKPGRDLDLVVALSNRGVAHAANGDHAMALEDLQEADALRPRLKAVPRNLDVLGQAMAIEK
jgi:tetratricopeptide (TPR) repeat protein